MLTDLAQADSADPKSYDIRLVFTIYDGGCRIRRFFATSLTADDANADVIRRSPGNGSMQAAEQAYNRFTVAPV